MSATVNVKSANWHFTSACNYNCSFCCMQKLTGELRSREKALYVLKHLVRLGIEKINFVGGEPMCSSLIYDAVAAAKKMGLVVSITTNGSLLDENALNRLSTHVDWIGLSIDSASDLVEKTLGRGDGTHVQHAIEVARIVHKLGMKLKINTTVTKFTFQEDLSELIRALDPHRWKVFQFLHVRGQNDHAVIPLAITQDEFQEFKIRHEGTLLRTGELPVFESADLMRDSYLMIAPSGNIFQNTQYPFREYPIDMVSTDLLEQILNVRNYASRGAVYAW
ncbi:Cyclic pyranopterin monophosphate synthase [Methanoculleus chikugoensis]|uniref:Cyclic pyranopterin monophosphate synthase n=1 Tax=Methanoculleus chikugoensis TaxID=118126 RepID=A0A1M4MNF1_9EURY|nr:viperin family antiviral radical SAM protein [Methanoculleus chikugoensis]SCL76387.1 Cyclic pyranopterin monophosphate synthase [Methanoculleus chikugoensis]